MKKPLCGLLLAVFALPPLAPLGACSSEPGSAAGPAEDAGDAAADAKPRRDAGKDAEIPPDSDALVCEFGPVAVTDPAKAAVAAQPGTCRPEDVAAGKGACLGAATATACNAFRDAHPRCAGCLFGEPPNTDAAGKALLPAVVPFGETSVIPNTDACAAVVLGNAATCGMAYVNETECFLSIAAPGPLGECLNQPDNPCTPYRIADTSPCGKALKERSADIDAACKGTQFDDTFAKVAAVLCE